MGDTTYLDYKNIIAKREGYGPIGNGGNGLILHTALAVEPDLGQPLGLLWQKLWHREPKTKPQADETPRHKKARIAAQRKASRDKPFEEKESRALGRSTHCSRKAVSRNTLQTNPTATARNRTAKWSKDSHHSRV